MDVAYRKPVNAIPSKVINFNFILRKIDAIYLLENPVVIF